MSAAFRDETWNPGRHHRVEPASGLNPADLVNGGFRNFRDVEILSRSLQGFRRGEDGRSALDNVKVVEVLNAMEKAKKLGTFVQKGKGKPATAYKKP